MDQAEFLLKRLEEYEQTLCIMYQCVEQLMNALRQLLVSRESLYCHNNKESEYDSNITGSNDGFSLVERRQIPPHWE